MSKIFKSKIYQENDKINANQLYKDIEDFIKKEKEEHQIEKLHRHHPLQHILNSTSGNYISPTAMKGFEQCPANYLYSKLVDEKIGSATSIGSSYHTIMERFYNSPKEIRNRKLIDDITNDVIIEDHQEDSKDDIKKYVDGYWESLDYINNKPMEHNQLNTSAEVFIKPIAKPLGINLEVPIYTLIDRIDIRDDGIYVIDYKTGWGDPNPYLLGEHGYLPQMIFYKWAAEAEFGEKIKKSMLCLPGASMDYKYVDMNVDSLVEQSKVIESILNHLDHIHEDRQKLIFEEQTMRYCGSCQFKYMCRTYLKSKNLDINQAKDEIDIEITIDDNYEE